MPAKLNLIGQQFGHLIVTAESGRTKAGRVLWECTCVCGRIRYHAGYDLKIGKCKSCGCKKTERLIAASYRHGQAQRNQQTPLYRAWQAMRQRVSKSNQAKRKYYADRNVRVCSRWNTFANFHADMKATWRPNVCLHRLDSSQDYSPENCKWMDRNKHARHHATNRAQRIRERDSKGRFI